MAIKEITESDTELCVKFPGTQEYLEPLFERLESFLKGKLEEEEVRYNVQLLASEAVTNAIEHGSREDSSLTVKVLLKVEPDHVVIEVEDEGEGFTPADVQDPTAIENLMKTGGRGLYLMETLSDSVEYENEGRRIRMTVAR